MRFTRSIQAKITVGILALLVLMTLATGAVVIDRSQEALRAQIADAHQARADRITAGLDDAIGGVARLVAVTAAQEEMWQPLPETSRDDNDTVPAEEETIKRVLLEHAHDSNDLVTAAVVLAGDGRAIMAEPFTVQEALAGLEAGSPADLRLAAIALAAQATTSSFVDQGPVPGAWFAAAPLSTQTREVWGTLVLIGETDALAAAMAQAARAETNLFLVDANGTLVADTAGLPTGTDLQEALAPLGADSTDARLITIDGAEHLATVQPLATAPWRVVVATDTKTAFAPADAMLRAVLLAAGIVILVGLAVALIVAHSLSAPVVRLRRAAERVAAGGYGTQVRPTTRDELADLTVAFNTMSTRLLEEQQRIRRQHESLEATVGDRTRELAEKNEELEAFAYAASHDLRTPLIALDWLLQEAREQIEQGADAEAVKATLARMEANVTGMDHLIDDLLELSRVGRTEGEPGPVPLLPIVQRVLDRIAAQQHERGTRIHVALDGDVVVMADSRRMEQLFVNILMNAIKYGNAGGNVWVRATPIGAPKRPWKWRVEVADDGPGVPEEQREEIFMLFRRGQTALDSDTEGTGVGLALTRKIVRAYGGEIKVTRAQEGGALFWFTLTAARPGGIGAAIQPIVPPASVQGDAEAPEHREGTQVAWPTPPARPRGGSA